MVELFHNANPGKGSFLCNNTRCMLNQFHYIRFFQLEIRWTSKFKKFGNHPIHPVHLFSGNFGCFSDFHCPEQKDCRNMSRSL